MTEEQLFQKLYQIIKGTDVTYKQVDSDLDEEGDVTIFFSGLETADHGAVRLREGLSDRVLRN